MAAQWKSILAGAAVAAMLILPAIAEDNGWTSAPWRSFDTKSVKIDSVVGKLRVEVKRRRTSRSRSPGTKQRVGDVTVRTDGDQLVITGDDRDEAVWTGRTGSTSTTRTTAPRISTFTSSCRRALTSMYAT